jgi:hypothetical protein
VTAILAKSLRVEEARAYIRGLLVMCDYLVHKVATMTDAGAVDVLRHMANAIGGAG